MQPYAARELANAARNFFPFSLPPPASLCSLPLYPFRVAAGVMQLQSGVSLGERKLGELRPRSRARARARSFVRPSLSAGMRLPAKTWPLSRDAARIVVCRRQAGDIMSTAKWQESDNKRTAELCFQFILTRYLRACVSRRRRDFRRSDDR